MFINVKHRTTQIEQMDDFALEGDVLIEALDKIAKINQILGGNELTLNGVKILLKEVNPARKITIVDVGCGNGDMLRILADYAEENDFLFNFIGIDANKFTIKYAKELSKHYPNISYRCENVFDKPFRDIKCDILLCTLTLHHFNNEEIIDLMMLFKEKSSIGIIVNDLHRSAVSYRLFQMLCFVFRLNDMSRKDGLISILKGFKREELIVFSKKIGINKYKIRWKWAFRYQWIISTQ